MPRPSEFIKRLLRDSRLFRPADVNDFGRWLDSIDGQNDINTQKLGGGGAALTISDEGTPLATAATALNFVGDGVTASGTGATKTITIPGVVLDETKITELAEETSPGTDDLLVIVSNPITTPVTNKVTVQNILALGNQGDVVGPSTAVDGHLAVFDGTTGKTLKDGGAVPAGGSFTALGAKVYRTTGGIAANPDLAIQFDGEVYDTDGIHDSATNQERLTCRTAGYYLIVGSFIFDTDGTNGLRQAYLLKNGTVVLATQGMVIAAEVRHNISIIDYLNVNDYVELHAYQGTGHSVSITYGADYSPVFMMQKIG